ncbi:11056_t:CDS:2 [Funneliformis caledonium]|uniref:11056_t:CDS:1 n=1 Tax=Funneliformis caledonium TaxID=1117310 RepID=A0A9N8W3N2_9GLOM|nr:11056_t:CDS:2 [Funneliformis caledonium]
MSDRKSDNTTSASSGKSAKPGPSNTKQKDYFRLDCKQIKIKPTSGTFDDDHMAVRFHHSTHEMSLWLNALKNEVFIPYDQFTGYRIAEYKELEISLLPNFNRRYYQNGVEIKTDPTNGLLEEATALIIIPRQNVNMSCLIVIDNLIGKYRNDISIPTRTRPGINDDPDESDEEYLVKFTMFGERGGVIVPLKIRLEDIVQTIMKKFKFEFKYNLLTYKNGVGAVIAIKDHEDWRVAKWESQYTGKACVDLYFT